MSPEETPDRIERLLAEQSEETKRVISEVLKIEKSKLSQLRVIGAKDEIVGAIKDAVK